MTFLLFLLCHVADFCHFAPNPNYPMKKNLSSGESLCRLVAAAACFYVLYFFEFDWKMAITGAIGLFFFITGIWRVCPVYSLFHISTRRPPEKR
ncbi:DUF2892 domain-containing protein [Flavobacterium sp. N1718]|uniref:YgaP family membrane protein n=2 Tax=unclassified Flavobacterium TaxID=196869 RepID=UPI0039B69DDA